MAAAPAPLPWPPPRPRLTRARARAQAAASQLSIPAGELAALQQRPVWSEDDVLAWAQPRVAEHPAKAAAAPHADRIARLRQLQARAARWRAPSSPLELLLLRVGAAVEASRLAAMTEEQLRALPEFEVAAAALAGCVGRNRLTAH